MAEDQPPSDNSDFVKQEDKYFVGRINTVFFLRLPLPLKTIDILHHYLNHVKLRGARSSHGRRYFSFCRWPHFLGGETSRPIWHFTLQLSHQSPCLHLCRQIPESFPALTNTYITFNLCSEYIPANDYN